MDEFKDEIVQSQPARLSQRDLFEEMQFDRITQNSYNPTPYEDSSYEIVGEPPKKAEFLPMPLEVISNFDVATDPMFADYGGLYEGKTGQRWHLPEHLAYAIEQAEEEERNREPTVEITATELAERLHRMREEGYQEGFQEASQKAVEERHNHARQITELLRDVGFQVREELARLEISCLGLALDIANRLLRSSVEFDPEYLIPIIQEAFRLAASSQIFTVRVSPQDLEFIRVCGVRDFLGKEDESWDFIGDETIRSGCVIETSAGQIDMQLDSAFDRIKEELIRIKR
jgi:flagellar assembly protein FliH